MSLEDSCKIDTMSLYWFKWFHMQGSFAGFLTFWKVQKLNKEYPYTVFCNHLDLSTIWRILQHSLLLFALLIVSKVLEELKYYFTIALIHTNVANKIVTTGCISNYVKVNSILIYFAAVVLLCWFVFQPAKISTFIERHFFTGYESFTCYLI